MDLTTGILVGIGALLLLAIGVFIKRVKKDNKSEYYSSGGGGGNEDSNDHPSKNDDLSVRR